MLSSKELSIKEPDSTPLPLPPTTFSLLLPSSPLLLPFPNSNILTSEFTPGLFPLAFELPDIAPTKVPRVESEFFLLLKFLVDSTSSRDGTEKDLSRTFVAFSLVGKVTWTATNLVPPLDVRII